MPDVKVGMLEGLVNADTGRGIEGEHLVEEVESVGVGVGEQAGKWLLGHEGEVSDVLLGTGRADAAESLLVGCAEDVEDLVELVDIITALEEGSSAEELGKNTANRPHINY